MYKPKNQIKTKNLFLSFIPHFIIFNVHSSLQSLPQSLPTIPKIEVCRFAAYELILILIILISFIISALHIITTSFIKSGKSKLDAFIFCRHRPPDIFSKIHLPLCRFAAFSVSLFFPYFLFPELPDIIYIFCTCRFCRFSVFLLLIIFPHFHILIYYILFIFSIQNIK